MKLLALSLVAVLFASVGLAQGVQERLEGEFTVLATATDGAGTRYVELDAMPSNLTQALLDGVSVEANQKFVVITPSEVHYALVVNERAFLYRDSWQNFVNWRNPYFDMFNVTIQGDGVHLTAASIAEAYVPSPVATPSRITVRTASPSPREGCESSTTPTRSTTTCYQDGRIASRVVCTTNPRTHEVTCRSDYF